MAYKKITDDIRKRIESRVRILLKDSRDCLRRKGTDMSSVSYSINDAYYAEAFGVMRALVVLDYGYFGSCNLNAIEEGQSIQDISNVTWWFEQLKDEVIEGESK